MGMHDRGQAQIGLILGLAAILSAAVAAIAIIDGVSTSPTRAQMATPPPAVPLDAVLVMVLLAILLAAFIYIYGGAS